MAETVKTITIVGGGLAGLSLGIGLRMRGVPVVVHEAGSYPRHRVCGEFISGVSDHTLRGLGVASFLDDARVLRRTRWYVRGREVLARELPEAARGISRYRLDARLAERLVTAGGELRTGSRRRREARTGQVWAAGRRPERDSAWLGLKIHVRGSAFGPHLEMHVGEEGYAGVAPVEDGRVNVCGLFRKRPLRRKGSELLCAYLEAAGLPEVAESLRDGERDESSFLGVSAFRLGKQDLEDDLCAVGDAECMIPPFTGNGMSMAFEAAELALDPLTGYAAGRASWGETVAAIRSGVARRFRRRLFTARVLHPCFFAAPGRRAMGWSARRGVFPFQALYRLLR